MKTPITIYGIVARFISFFVPVRKKHWVFGSDYGMMYREGSRYLLEYMLCNHPDYKCTFITQSQSVKNDLDKKGIPCEMNFSLRGMIIIAQAEIVFTTQMVSDVFFVYKKKGRRFFFLSHGQPYKACFLATPKKYGEARFKKSLGINSIIQSVSRFLTIGYNYWESDFFTSTSEYLVPYNKLYYGDKSSVKILGMPRNDVLFDDCIMNKERWLPNMEGKMVITYMPTHRDYGYGDVSPIPFENNREVLEWMKKNNVVLLVKQHPNMERKQSSNIHSDVIIDITKMKFDPQVCLYHSDVLITDYSSVWIDYLILRKPLIFYYYDDYEKNDTGILYDLREDPPGLFCYNEWELYNCIKDIKEHYETMRPTEHIVSKYHKYVDGNSCERYYNEIIKG